MSKKVIICVDDEPLILESLELQLVVNLGDQYVYQFAENAGDAWELIEELNQQKTEILLVISDWLMPDMKGDEFLIQIHRRYPKIPLVLLSGLVNEKTVKRLKEAKVSYRYLPKPWEEKELISAVNLAEKSSVT